MLKLAIILIMVFIAVSICAYASAEPGLAVGGVSSCSFSEWVNKQPDNKPMSESAEKILIREQWARNIGGDIFYPYF